MHVKNTHDAYTLRGAPPAGLIPGKLLPPQQHCSVVARPELLHLLDTGRERRVTLLLASAGYGKTTLAAQWRNRLLVRGVKVAWLTLDEEDREDLMFAAEIFVQTMPDDIKKLQLALEQKDYDKCYFMAHNLKSVVGHFGQGNLASLAEALEQASEKELAQDVCALTAKFIESLRSLAAEVEAELEKVDLKA